MIYIMPTNILKYSDEIAKDLGITYLDLLQRIKEKYDEEEVCQINSNLYYVLILWPVCFEQRRPEGPSSKRMERRGNES